MKKLENEKNQNVEASIARPNIEEISENNVVAGPVSARKEKGITLIALIITIIVMLILVMVTIQVLFNTGLFDAAGKATQKWEAEQDKEQELAGGTINVDGKEYLSIEDYLAGIMEGEGTEADPYTIDNIEALVQFAHSVTNGKTYEGEYVKLTRDLDFKSVDSYINATRTDYEQYGYTGELMTALTTGEGFKPIGREVRNNQDDELYNFAGTFDGNGKIISNLYIDKEYGEENPNFECGLFAINYGVIKNLGVESCNISVSSDKCLEIGVISARNAGEINSCYASGEINYNCELGRYGGITGVIQANGIVQDCYNKASVELSADYTPNVQYIGGITGYISDGTIMNCYNNGLVSVQNGTGGKLYIGGILGSTPSANHIGSIDNCFNCKEINATGTVNELYFGGIVGHCKNPVKTVYNSGNIVSNVTATGSYNAVGAIVGVNHNQGTIENAKYLSSTSANGAGINWGTADITNVDSIDDMPTVLSVVGDAFKADTNNINGGYPLLKWQSSTAN